MQQRRVLPPSNLVNSARGTTFDGGSTLLPAPSNASESKSAANSLAATLKQNFNDLVEHDEHGRPRLSFVLPDAAALDGLTNVLARLIVRTESARAEASEEAD